MNSKVLGVQCSVQCSEECTMYSVECTVFSLQIILHKKKNGEINKRFLVIAAPCFFSKSYTKFRNVTMVRKDI